MFENIWMKSFVCAIISFAITYIGIKLFLIYANKSKLFYQPIRENGPKNHLKEKQNTPTMGGFFIVASTVGVSCFTLNLMNPYVFITLLCFVLFAIIGLTDDLIKVFKKDHKGFRGSVKIVVQFAIICAAILWLGYYNVDYLRGRVFIPIADPRYLPIGIALYAIFVTFVVVGTSNAVNLTDGLDGLVSVPIIINLICLTALVSIASSPYTTEALKIPFIDQTKELLPFCYILIGSVIAFLMFNLKPAKIFMGDVGSLSIGAALGTIAVIVMEEFVFFMISFLFVLEALSVILQVGSYKLFKKRVFLMAPLHHHYEKLGYSETKVVLYFWLASVVFAILGMTIYFM